MGQLEKLKVSFRSCRGSYDWRKFLKLLNLLGYEEVKTSGKTGGSRVRFYHAKKQHVIIVHVPHDGEMGHGMVKRIRDDLSEKGMI